MNHFVPILFSQAHALSLFFGGIGVTSCPISEFSLLHLESEVKQLFLYNFLSSPIAIICSFCV